MNVEKSIMEVDENIMKMPILNPMAFYPRFPHIAEQIFEKIKKESLKICRLLSKSWLQYIDNQNLLWNKMIENEDSNKVFQSACKNGHSKMAAFLIEKSDELKIDLNAGDRNGWTAFHWICYNDHSKILEILVQKSVEFNIDLNTKN